MRVSRSFVSLRTYALAFAVVLTPALMQTQYTCQRTGDTRLASLEVVVLDVNRIVFDPALRVYDLWLPAEATQATLRAVPTDPLARVTWYVPDGAGTLASGILGVGGGEVTVDLPPDGYALYVGVFPPEGATNTYIVNMNPVCPQGDPCHNGGVPGTCSGDVCVTACIPTTEICDDGIDNDCDGNVDFADDACSSLIALSVDLSSTVLEIDGPSVPYTATIDNPVTSIARVGIDGWIEQGAASRAGLGTNVRCGVVPDGELPLGTCVFDYVTRAQNTSAGTGTVVPGPATVRFVLDLREGANPPLVLREIEIPVTLVAACAPTAEICDDGIDNDCDGLADSADDDCCQGVCCNLPQGTACRPPAGPCDIAEVCDGSSPQCPPDAFAGSETTCRAAWDVCDAAESCDGYSAICPVDSFAPAGTPCTNWANGICDGAGECSAVCNEEEPGLVFYGTDYAGCLSTGECSIDDPSIVSSACLDEATLGQGCSTSQAPWCQRVFVDLGHPDHLVCYYCLDDGSRCSECAGLLENLATQDPLPCDFDVPECIATQCEPTAEICDGLDNDCDGAVDENWVELGDACVSGLGVCQGTGTMVCGADGLDAECNAVATEPPTSYERYDYQCDDLLDNDCDGAVDFADEDCAPFTQVSVGDFTTCGLTSVGAFRCWPTSGSVPPRAPEPGGPFTQVSAIKQCAVTVAGEVQCDYGSWWLVPGSPFTQVSSAGDWACVVPVTGDVECFRYLDDFRAYEVYERLTQVSVGLLANCGLISNGSAYCWSPDRSPYIDGWSYTTPSGGYTQVSSGNDTACGLRPEGYVECWNAGTGEFLYSVQFGSFTQIAAGEGGSCGVDVTGTVWCWDSATGAAWFYDASGGPFTQVSVSKESSSGLLVGCGVTVPGTVQCWDLVNATPLYETGPDPDPY